MVTVSESIELAVDQEAVFEYLDEPHSHVEITPSLVGVEDIERLDNGGKRATFTYSIAGVHLDGDLVQTVHDPPERMVFDLEGQLPGEIRLTVEAIDGHSRVIYGADYEIPGRVLSAVAEPFVRRYNEREAKTLLANLKTRLEEN